MENLIVNATECPLPLQLSRLLPLSVNRAIEGITGVEELRLSAGRQAWVRRNGQNLALDVRLDQKQLEEIVERMCGGSLYAHTESICRGYLSLGGGIRVGICGRAVLEGDRVTGLSEISSLCIRIPHAVETDVSLAVSLLERFGFVRGLLVYAPPGGGKTTFLRCLARRLATGALPRRVAVVDTRDELAYSLGSPLLCLDILSGYPKGYGIEVATRTLGAQVIICDELGGEEDASAILRVQSGGVPLVASAHAASLEELLKRRSLVSLHKAGVFGGYLALSREHEPRLTLAEDANAYI